jgi:hypothetical protein
VPARYEAYISVKRKAVAVCHEGTWASEGRTILTINHVTRRRWRGQIQSQETLFQGKSPHNPTKIAAGLVGPITDPNAFDYITLLVIRGRNQFFTWYIKHGRVSSPFSVVTKGRNYKPILRESSQRSYQLTTKQNYALLRQLHGLIKCVNYSLQPAPTYISYTLLHSACGLYMSFEFTRSNATTIQVTSP